MTSAATTANSDVNEQAPARRRSLASIALKGGALLLTTAASVIAICVGVPDGNDYAKASLLKHAALEADAPRKIVLVGGSNLAFGIDSTIIREMTGCPVVNMGMNGYFGPRYMLSEVEPNLRSGDVVVMAWEYDNYFKPVDGTATDLLMVTKSNPNAFRYLSTSQMLAVAGQYPYVAQQKVLRLMTEARDGVKSLVAGGDDSAVGDVSINEIETLSGFTSDGDLVSHLGVDWTYDRENGIDLVNTPRDPDIVPLMASFAERAEAKGVAAMVSFTPVIDYFYTKQKPAIDAIQAELSSVEGLRVPRPASDFVFPPSQHFDTVYHLNAEGRAIRSRMLADDILKEFGDRARCGPQRTS